ncbi:Dolichyl-phosphate-mannose-proteinmannosyltransferase [Spraguea lophii 42_110]|uniref:Dolichyl-phosphate-mannose--protein mannosyltransferase n=1 Tax=Spraguea lophii (strain 42_110) TaxID=1358809 RepID=S7WB23_SPRLO|nr:Dolichyl-phosphate-mannose-proteinmannosyltransferase [Spraguea lophii 42_110]
MPLFRQISFLISMFYIRFIKIGNVLFMKILKKKRQFFNKEMLASILIVCISIMVRTYAIERGDYVIWDEAHFGKFSSKYLNRLFYFDVHPPLGKMLTGLSGYLFNQDKDFSFESGTQYPQNMDYVGMRRFHAVIASFISLIIFKILKVMNHDIMFRFFFSLLFTFENGFVSISRLILLDSHLLFFTGLTTLFIAKHFKDSYFQHKRNHRNIVLLGISIGCVMSVKWIGCLTTVFVGLFIIYELWIMITSKKKITAFFEMLFIRTLFLIAVPVFIYIFMFCVHFKIVNRSSSDEGYMSSLFQAGLKNSSIGRIKKYIDFGNLISIKSSKLGGGSLHSHDLKYPNSPHQQITSYHHKDSNNNWAFQKVTDNKDVSHLQNNDEVVLLHTSTKKYLHVSLLNGYFKEGLLVEGTEGELTRANVFKIIIDSDDLSKEKYVKTLTTKFRIYNTERDCYITNSERTYPNWGHSQGEILCAKEKSSNNLWNIEKNSLKENDIESFEYTEIKKLKTTVIKHIIELNKSMYTTNKSFTQNEQLERNTIVSKPHEWFILKKGLRMTSWDGDKYKFLMFGNPVIWYISCLSVILSPIVLIFRIIYFVRFSLPKNKLRLEVFEVVLYSGGWAIHYFPFFLVQRVCYFHHYYPALFFAMLSISYLLRFMPRRTLYIFVFLSIFSFIYFSPLTYGFIDIDDIKGKRWISSWMFYD